jgi:hypothetical protein
MIFRASEVSVSVISKSSFSSCASFLLPLNLSEASLGLSAGHPFEFVNMGMQPSLELKMENEIDVRWKCNRKHAEVTPARNRCGTEVRSL